MRTFLFGLFVLCCCQTYGGGLCCGEQLYCTGGFVTGCLCSLE